MAKHPQIFVLQGLDNNLCQFVFIILVHLFRSIMSVALRPREIMSDWIFSNQRVFGRPRGLLP